MTGYMLKKRLRASVTRVSSEFCVSAAHPEDGDGIKIQSEMRPDVQAKVGHRFHCFTVPAAEIPALIAGLKKALRWSRATRRMYMADLEGK